MRIESKLCHVSENKVIVQVTGWVKEQNLGSALAEGPTVEVAEDKAISRLNKRINHVVITEANENSFNGDKIITHSKTELPIGDKNNINKEPSDWSYELTLIDCEIERLKWSRDDEIKFLEKNLGLNNRNKITKYSDILKYVNLLKNTDTQCQSTLSKKNINSLIAETDNILRELSWDNLQGREYLKKEFNVSTRKELNEEQLTSFVEKLKSIRNNI